MKAADEVLEVNREELQAVLERKREALGEEDYQKLQTLLRGGCARCFRSRARRRRKKFSSGRG